MTTSDQVSIPEYAWFTEIPPNSDLRTKTQLAQAGKKPGGPVRARVVWVRRRRIVAIYDLFSEGEAIQKVATAKQLAAIEKAQIALRTCRVCTKVYPKRLQGRICADCEQAAAEAREKERLEALASRAQRWFTTQGAVVIDTETTSLEGYIVEIAIADMQGNVLFNSRVNPLEPISDGAHAVHGISDHDLVDCPTFAELFPQLSALLDGRLIVAYNAEFDSSVLARELRRMATNAGVDWYEALNSASKQMSTQRWRCAMILYSEWVGDWSDYHEDYRWQRLPFATHSALDDCLATIKVLKLVQGEP